jgi:hypothetical protein
MKFVICFSDRLVLVDKKEESIEYSDVAKRKCKSEWLSWLQRNQTPYLQVLRVSQLVLCCCVSVYGERKKTDFTDQSDFDWLHIRLSGLAMCRGNP